MWEDLQQADNFQQLLNFFSQYSEYSNSQFVKVSKSLWQRHLSGCTLPSVELIVIVISRKLVDELSWNDLLQSDNNYN